MTRKLGLMLVLILLMGVGLAGWAGAAGVAPAPALLLTMTPSRVPPTPTPEVEVTLFSVEVLEAYPHDTDSFTQGLVWNGETFYESAGLYGESDVREVERDSGEVLRQTPLADEFFAEGLAQVEDRLIQITWQENTAFVYDIETFEVVETFSYETEGWGLCYDGEVLYMSDGTPNLYTRDPQTFELLETVPVTFDGEPVGNLNELECVDGKVWGNIWQTDFIVRLDPATGNIDGVVNAADLLTPEQTADLGAGGVLNGIAYDPEDETFYITGKLWPALFKVRFVPVEQGAGE
jgi:glutaminyl-peptide cyclotransferase